jgi:hypothetical protein
MYVYYTLSQFDRQHRLKAPPYTELSRSFVKAFLQQLYVLTSNLTQNIIDIDNTSREVETVDAGLGVGHPGLAAGDDSNMSQNTTWFTSVYADDCGIQVGTSSTAVAVADDNLVAPVANGSSAGQLVYYGCWGLNYTTGASSASFDIERIFRNDSGGSIVIAEIGAYCVAGRSSGNAETDYFGFCILRDVISPTVTVNNGEYLKVKYTITVSN